jgi:hypothetical protein
MTHFIVLKEYSEKVHFNLDVLLQWRISLLLLDPIIHLHLHHQHHLLLKDRYHRVRLLEIMVMCREL